MVKLIQNIIKINNIFEKAILLLCLLSSIIADAEWCDYIQRELSGVYKHTKDTKTQTITLVLLLLETFLII